MARDTHETGKSSFFSHRDPAIVKWMAERRLEVCAVTPMQRCRTIVSNLAQENSP